VRKAVLISGIPGAGKSHFGRWMAQHKGALYIDVDLKGIDAAGIRPVWNEFLRTFDARAVAARLTRDHEFCALVWGFPVHSLRWVRALQESGGLVPWWFTGDRAWARKYLAERQDTDLAQFDRQHADIVRAWPEISRVFGERLIDTVAADGTRTPCEELYRRIFGTTP